MYSLLPFGTYHIARKFGGELNLAVWRSAFATAKLKSANISYSHIYVWRSLTEPPNLNPPIFLQWQFWAQLPNLIPANISGYTVITLIKRKERSLFGHVFQIVLLVHCTFMYMYLLAKRNLL